MTNTSFVPSICIQRSVILILKTYSKKKYACRFFPWKIYFPTIFDFHFHENPRFHKEFQAMSNLTIATLAGALWGFWRCNWKVSAWTLMCVWVWVCVCVCVVSVCVSEWVSEQASERESVRAWMCVSVYVWSLVCEVGVLFAYVDTVYMGILFFMLNWMFQHDYLDTCCFEFHMCMCFVVLYKFCTCSAQLSMFHMERRSIIINWLAQCQYGLVTGIKTLWLSEIASLILLVQLLSLCGSTYFIFKFQPSTQIHP